ncbi:unnamed protein product, partial [Amoebophrya sp. A25]
QVRAFAAGPSPGIVHRSGGGRAGIHRSVSGSLGLQTRTASVPSDMHLTTIYEGTGGVVEQQHSVHAGDPLARGSLGSGGLRSASGRLHSSANDLPQRAAASEQSFSVSAPEEDGLCLSSPASPSAGAFVG